MIYTSNIVVDMSVLSLTSSRSIHLFRFVLENDSDKFNRVVKYARTHTHTHTHLWTELVLLISIRNRRESPRFSPSARAFFDRFQVELSFKKNSSRFSVWPFLHHFSILDVKYLRIQMALNPAETPSLLELKVKFYAFAYDLSFHGSIVYD